MQTRKVRAGVLTSMIALLVAAGCAGPGAAATAPSPSPSGNSGVASSPNIVWGTAACATPADSQQTTYVVRTHDTDSSIADCLHVTVAQLHAANPTIPYAAGNYTQPDGGTATCSSPCMQLKPGDVLAIPTPGP